LNLLSGNRACFAQGKAERVEQFLTTSLNANEGIMGAAIEFGVLDCVIRFAELV
jgi:hypothetical protein